MENTNQSVERDIKATETIIANLKKDLEGFLDEKGALKADSPSFTKSLFFMLTHHTKHLEKLNKA